jgi:UDP-N-acetyl-D-glucosamine dehydrogenase
MFVRKVVCVQGLGFVGAAMAVATAGASDESGKPLYDVIGVDLDTETGASRVEAIKHGRFPFETADEELLEAVNQGFVRGNLSATTNPGVYSRADVILIDVQFDIAFRAANPRLDFKTFTEALQTVALYMRPEALIIVESTVPPGTCEHVAIPTIAKVLEERGFDSSKLNFAHASERVMPGKNYLNSVTNFWRVYAGSSEESANLCEEFLSSIVNTADFPLTRLSSTTASETTKVLENTYRAVNIAFMAEWTDFAEAVGLDLFEIVSAIQKRPTHANIRFPGLGIGGYCLTKDPTFTPAASRDLFGLDLHFPFSELAVTQRAEMPLHVTKKLRNNLGGSFSQKSVLICGVSYRSDVADTRFSPSEDLYDNLLAEGATVHLHDPLVKWWDEVGLEISSELPLFADFDAVVFAVPHRQYQELDLWDYIENPETTYILDAFMVFTAAQRKAYKDRGIRIQAIGVGER